MAFSEICRWLDTHNGSVSALAGIAVAFFTAVLWRSTEKLWRAGEKSAGLTRKALQAAHDANAIAERSIFEQNRPWVFVDEIAWGEGGLISVSFKNSGFTPARDLCKAVEWRVFSRPFPSSALPQINPDNSTFLPPGATEIITTPSPGTMQKGQECLIRVGLSYRLPDSSRDTLYVDFALGEGSKFRKVTPVDFQAYKDKHALTVGEVFAIPD
jgi:hypothetical protein